MKNELEYFLKNYKKKATQKDFDDFFDESHKCSELFFEVIETNNLTLTTAGHALTDVILTIVSYIEILHKEGKVHISGKLLLMSLIEKFQFFLKDMDEKK